MDCQDNRCLEFGFLSGFNSASSSGSGFAASNAPNVNSSDVKTESLDDDVILVDDDAPEPAADGAGDDAVPGAAVQQITRRVTITTNIQGQNVKYEQVWLPSRPVTQISPLRFSRLDSGCS